MVGSYHTLRLQESESDFDEIAEIAAEQFHINRSADQLILFHEKTFEPGGVTTEGEIPGTSKQASFSLKCLMVKVYVQAATQAQKNDVQSCLFSLAQRDEARHRKTTSGPVQGNHWLPQELTTRASKASGVSSRHKTEHPSGPEAGSV